MNEKNCVEFNNINLFLLLKRIFFSVILLILPSFAYAQIDLEDKSPQEKEVYNTLPGEPKNGSILDATNPLELLNRLRRATAMDDATLPSDAIDDAIRAFEEDNVKDK